MAAVWRKSFLQDGLTNMFKVCPLAYSRRAFSTTKSWSMICYQLTSRNTNNSLTGVGRLNWFSCNSWSRSLASKPKHRMIPTDSSKFSEQPIIHVSATYNNTMLTLTDYKGNTLAWTSAGTEGYKNSRRGSSVAAQQASMSLAKKASDFGIKKVRVKVKGVGNGRQASIKSLSTTGLTIVSITDVTPIPHNGCRPKKARRI